MTDEKMGRLTPVALRDVWANESREFTTWLAQEENLEILGEELRCDLELEAKEKEVGTFRADILCKDIATGAWVLIENQLERTDHIHLGQLLTYASGLDAATIVWIASKFKEEHRSTLDWLNKITSEEFSFFGVELQLWKIGDSLKAPKFNIVSKPNDWSRTIARAAAVLSETQTMTMQRNYWEAFHEALKLASGPITGKAKPQANSFMEYGIGRSGFRLGAGMNTKTKQIRTYLYIYKESANNFFKMLQDQRIDIERELGYSIIWDNNPICISKDADPNNRNDWQRQHEWLAKHINDFHRVFRSRIRELSA